MAAITDKQNIGMQTKYDVCYELELHSPISKSKIFEKIAVIA